MRALSGSCQGRPCHRLPTRPQRAGRRRRPPRHPRRRDRCRCHCRWTRRKIGPSCRRHWHLHLHRPHRGLNRCRLWWWRQSWSRCLQCPGPDPGLQRSPHQAIPGTARCWIESESQRSRCRRCLQPRQLQRTCRRRRGCRPARRLSCPPTRLRCRPRPPPAQQRRARRAACRQHPHQSQRQSRGSRAESRLQRQPRRCRLPARQGHRHRLRGRLRLPGPAP